ncbi:hypoxanthine/guanine phosphoribosyltransferase [Natronorubrum halophilum]|uniref:hypoxanthine/guanine phosphoribosyltransferase n=1 Tax=Natronorubrum halophilum TaxID=1702106 RepID=UPI000EF6ADA3|nr:hypoxanthine/guanine phosphoribosyltransferase [Natronorubrum halophilum]
MDSTLEPLARSLREAPVVDRDGYEYFVHGVTDGIPPVDPAVLQAVADGIRERIDLDDIDTLVAPEAMGIHHGTALSLATGIPLVVVRKRSYGFPEEVAVHQETSYGESELYLNGVDAGDRVVLIDDVRSSGGTIEAVCDALEAVEAEVVDIVVVLRRVDADHEDAARDVTSLLDVRVRDGAVEVLGFDDLE